MHFNGMQLSLKRAPMFRGYWTKQSLGVSITGTDLDGGPTRLANSIRMAGVGYDLETPIWRAVHGQVLVGAQGSYHWVFQTVTDGRFGNSPVQAKGETIGSDCESTAGLSRFTLPLEGEIYFPHRFWLSATIAPALYLYDFKAAGSAPSPWGWEPGVAVGHQF